MLYRIDSELLTIQKIPNMKEEDVSEDHRDCWIMAMLGSGYYRYEKDFDKAKQFLKEACNSKINYVEGLLNSLDNLEEKDLKEVI